MLFGVVIYCNMLFGVVSCCSVFYVLFDVVKCCSMLLHIVRWLHVVVFMLASTHYNMYGHDSL